MAGRDLTPSEKIDKEYEDLIIWGAVMIGVMLLCFAIYTASSQQDPLTQDIIFNLDQNKFNNVDSNGDETTRVKNPIVYEPQLILQKDQDIQEISVPDVETDEEEEE